MSLASVPPLSVRLRELASAARAVAGAALRRRTPEGLSLQNRGDGPPDLDELWRDFNRKLSGMFGGKGGGSSNNSGQGGNGGNEIGRAHV